MKVHSQSLVRTAIHAGFQTKETLVRVLDPSQRQKIAISCRRCKTGWSKKTDDCDGMTQRSRNKYEERFAVKCPSFIWQKVVPSAQVRRDNEHLLWCIIIVGGEFIHWPKYFYPAAVGGAVQLLCTNRIFFYILRWKNYLQFIPAILDTVHSQLSIVSLGFTA